jgi:hypothetical protein
MKMKTYKFTALSYEAQKLAIHNYMLSSNGLIDDDGVARYQLEESKNRFTLTMVRSGMSQKITR